MATIDQYLARDSEMGQIGRLADRLSDLGRLVAQPSLVQLLLRSALAVPLWRSGGLKWDGFLQLNDTAVELFSGEFMLHPPGGRYPYPTRAVFAFLSGFGPVRLFGAPLC